MFSPANFGYSCVDPSELRRQHANRAGSISSVATSRFARCSNILFATSALLWWNFFYLYIFVHLIIYLEYCINLESTSTIDQFQTKSELSSDAVGEWSYFVALMD